MAFIETYNFTAEQIEVADTSLYLMARLNTRRGHKPDTRTAYDRIGDRIVKQALRQAQEVDETFKIKLGPLASFGLVCALAFVRSRPETIADDRERRAYQRSTLESLESIVGIQNPDSSPAPFDPEQISVAATGYADNLALRAGQLLGEISTFNSAAEDPVGVVEDGGLASG